MFKHFKLLCSLIVVIFIHNSNIYSQYNTNEEILSGQVIIKVKPEYREFCFNDGVAYPKLLEILNNINFYSCVKKFPLSSPPATVFNRFGKKLVDLSLIYEVKFDKHIPVNKAISQLEHIEILEYAVPCVLPRVLYTPSDPGINNQYHLNTIKAYQAWDISKGDTSILIGIIDTGTDWSHVDLAGNIKYNYYDPPDGIDNDNDGYIDNFRGWDMADNDSNPMYETNAHGVHVSGISSASTDNGIGIAGVGYKSRFLPVKISDSNNKLSRSYEGIVYAAEHGCNIINCSWGGTTSPGPYGQDIINYAVYNHDALVVAACGNDNNEVPFYPASYDNVISVAATDQSDIKNSTSSYGIYVDVCAPGKNIFSTWANGSYISSSGTSMAAPIISGCAAIVKSIFPHYNALQIGEQLRATSDNIDSIGTNLLFQGKLGSGRVNLFRAITEITPSVRIENIITDDGNDNIYVSEDTIMISADFINYLENVNNLSVVISSESPYIDIIQANAVLGDIPTMGVVNNNSNPFIITVLSGIPTGTHEVEIKVQYTANSYSAFEYFVIKINKNYVDITSGLTKISVASRGKIGFNDYFGREGLGVKYREGKNMLFCGGLMLGSSQGQVSDNIYSATGDYDEDFLPLTNITGSLYFNNYQSNYSNLFSDEAAGVMSMGLEIKQKITAYHDIDSSKFIVFNYYIYNKSLSPLPNFYVGLFMDWDIANYSANRTLWDASLNLSYSFPINGGTHTGIMLVSPNNPKTYAFDTDGTANSIQIYDGFSTTEKYSALSTDRFSAGQNTSGNDIASLVSSGPYNLLANDSINVVFAILAGDNLYDIKNSALMLKDKYFNISNLDKITDSRIIDINIFPNPATDYFTINLDLPESGQTKIQLFNIVGQLQDVLLEKYLQSGKHQITIDNTKFNSGIYFCKIETGDYLKTIKLILQ